MDILKFVFIGLASGLASGVLGIGGGLIMIPLLVYLLGYNQHLAQGTSLAVLVLPVGILGAWRYYQAGNANLSVVPWIAGAMMIGAWIGANGVQGLSNLMLQRIFGGVLLLISLKMILGK